MKEFYFKTVFLPFIIFILPNYCISQTIQLANDLFITTNKNADSIKRSFKVFVSDVNLAQNSSRQLFASIPGLNFIESGSAGQTLQIGSRGMNPFLSNHFNILLNGRSISADMFGYSNLYFTPPFEALEQIDINKGFSSVSVGPQFGGTMNLIYKKAPIDKPIQFETKNSFGSQNFFNSFNAISGTKNKFSYYAFYQFRRGDGWRLNNGFTLSNSAVVINYQMTKKHSLSFEINNNNFSEKQAGGLTEYAYIVSPQSSNRARNWNQFNATSYQLQFQAVWNKNLFLKTSVYGQNGLDNVVGFNALANVADTVNKILENYNYRRLQKLIISNVALEAQLDYIYNKNNLQQKITGGIRWYQANNQLQQNGLANNDFEYTDKLIATRYPRDLNFFSSNQALFIQFANQITKKISIQGGFRYERIYSSVFGRYNVDKLGNIYSYVNPQIFLRNHVLLDVSFNYKLKKSQFFLKIANVYKPLQYIDIIPTTENDDVDSNLTDPQGVHFEVGWQGKLLNDVAHFDLRYYFSQYNNLVGNSIKNINTTNAYLFKTNTGSGYASGIETYFDINILKVFQPQNKSDFWIYTNLTLNFTKYQDYILYYRDPSTNTILKKDATNKEFEYAPTYILNVGFKYEFEKFSATLQSRFNSGMYTDALNTFSPNSVATIGYLNSYKVFDFNAAYKYNKNLQFRFSFNNITNESYATFRANGTIINGIIPADGRSYFLGIDYLF